VDYKLLLLAKVNLKGIANWYESLQENLGKRFLNTIKNEIKILKANPLYTK